MTNLLILDTASACCWVGLRHSGGLLLERSTESRRAAQQLLPMTEKLLRAARINLSELAAIGVINGPGSFTGMRIGVGIAQGLAYAAQIPVITVSSLQALAVSAAQEHGGSHWLIAEAAREQECYLGGYSGLESGPGEAVFPDQVIQDADAQVLQSLSASSANWGVAGSRADWLCETLQDYPLTLYPANIEKVSPDRVCALIEAKLAAGEITQPEATLPNYVKDQLDYS